MGKPASRATMKEQVAVFEIFDLEPEFGQKSISSVFENHSSNISREVQNITGNIIPFGAICLINIIMKRVFGSLKLEMCLPVH